MNRKYVIVLNPVAGKGKALSREPVIRDFLTRSGIDFSLLHTQYPGHAREIARDCAQEGSCTIIAAGGDGTCNEIVNGLFSAQTETQPCFGVLPLGSGNDFCFANNLPLKLHDSLQILLNGKTKLVDAGMVQVDNLDPVYFINGSGIGFDTMVTVEAGKAKHLRGVLGYIYGVVKTLVKFPLPHEVELKTDEHTHSLRASLISCMIGKRLGGGFLIAPHADTQDGLFDLSFTHQEKRRLMIRDLLKYRVGRQGELDDTWVYRSSMLSVKSAAGALAVHADGDPVSTTGSELHTQCLPGALKVLC